MVLENKLVIIVKFYTDCEMLGPSAWVIGRNLLLEVFNLYVDFCRTLHYALIDLKTDSHLKV